MLKFKQLELKDIPLFRKYLNYKVENNCDCTIGASFMWRDYFLTSYALYEDMLFIKSDYGDDYEAFCFPLAKDREKALSVLKEHCEECDIPLIFCSVTNKEIELIDKVFPKYEIQKEREWFDYVYNSEDMVNFAGRKYSGQRNHINKFKKLYEDFSFEEITDENLGEVKEFFDNFVLKYDKGTESYREEAEKVREVLNNYAEYGMFGGLIRVKDDIIAMSVGEIVDDTLFVHIEKADIAYHGAYQMIVQQFAKHYVTEDVKYINREDDTGDEGLRTSKLSYHPIHLLEKSTVTVIE